MHEFEISRRYKHWLTEEEFLVAVKYTIPTKLMGIYASPRSDPAAIEKLHKDMETMHGMIAMRIGLDRWPQLGDELDEAPGNDPI